MKSKQLGWLTQTTEIILPQKAREKETEEYFYGPSSCLLSVLSVYSLCGEKPSYYTFCL